ncbi:hypothetical protein GDO78_003047 [Eleutherodactylus coqui]|uniref:Uncharacterized protein n=1 Tax=Eleutherodactylus coqui TaxID=57060 RepID=A0A8J6EX13_ELECQ|nr:hypothetical protein GDO78_003047 [Eleutherodactylus coqui]
MTKCSSDRFVCTFTHVEKVAELKFSIKQKCVCHVIQHTKSQFLHTGLQVFHSYCNQMELAQENLCVNTPACCR